MDRTRKDTGQEGGCFTGATNNKAKQGEDDAGDQQADQAEIFWDVERKELSSLGRTDGIREFLQIPLMLSGHCLLLPHFS